MQDRIPTPGQEGRVLITPEDGSPAFYATIQMADGATVFGTPWSKETVLQDPTCELLGLPPTAVPDDAFSAIPRVASEKMPSTFQKLMTGRLI